jgi:hypothetical protein
VSFAVHSDILHHEVFSRLSPGAFGLWFLAGCWTSANETAGVVPSQAFVELAEGWNEVDLATVVDELVQAGVWTPVAGGHRMEYGPSDDFPLPIWRYDKEPPANGLFEILPDPEP